MKASTDTICVIALINPFTREVLEARADVGMSVRDIVGAKTSEQVLVFINGEPIKYGDWEQTFVVADNIVNVVNMPAGTGRDLFRLALVVAVAYFAWWSAPYFAGQGAGAAGWTAAAKAGTAAFAKAGFYQAATFAVGSMMVNTLVPPPIPGGGGLGEPSRLNALTGSRNNYAPYAPVPNVYGTHKLFPPFAALPYTEIIGNDQYFNALYCVGLGQYNIVAEDLKIGDTPLLDFEGAEAVITEQPVFASIVEEQLAIVLAQNAAPPADGESATRTSATNASALSIDIHFPAGLIHTQPDGDRSSAAVDLRLEYAVAGSGDWINVRTTNWQTATQGSQTVAGEPNWNALAQSINGLWSHPTDATLFRVTGKSNDGKRVGLKWTVASGQYDVRVTRVRTYKLSNSIGGAQWEESSRWTRLSAMTVWAALRSYRNTNAVVVDAGEMTFVRVRLKASEELSGVVDTLNVVTTRKLRVWDGNNWTAPQTMGTGSLPWAFVDVLTGQGNARPLSDSQINLDEMLAWSAECIAGGRTYNEVIDYSTSIFDALRRITSVGRAGISNRNGQWTVIREQSAPVPVQYFTPRNSHGFNSTKQLIKIPHALKVRFISKDADYQEDEIIVYNDGYSAVNATRFEVLELKGITDSDYAWKTGRYHLAALQLRPEVYNFSTDVEHIVCERGDHIRVAHDVPLWGTATARIKSVVGDVITLDELVATESTQYRMRIRKKDGTAVLITVSTTVGLEVDEFTRTATNEGTWSNVNADDLVMLGSIGAESVMLLVVAIEPGSDLSANIVAIDSAPEVLDADTGPIPSYDPGITLPVDPRLIFPPKPYNVQVFSGDNLQSRLQDGSSSPRMLITWDYPGEALSAFPGTTVQVRYRELDDDGTTGEYKYISGIPVAEGFAIALDIEIGSRYAVQVMALSRHDAPSGYTVVVVHTVSGATLSITPPPTPVTVSAAGRVRVICNFDETWDENADIAHVEFGKGNTTDPADITEIVKVAVPTKLAGITAMGVFLLDVGLTRYFFARIVTVSQQSSVWTTGVAGTAFGLSARYVILIAEGQIFSYDNSTGTPVLIGPSAIDLTVLRNGVAGPVTWQAWDAQGVQILPVTDILTLPGGNNETAIIPASKFGNIPNNDHITIRITSEDLFDEMTVMKIQSGRDGEAGNALNGILSNEWHGVPTAADGTGAIVLSAGGTFRVWEGLSEITTGSGVVYNVVGGADSGADHILEQNGLRMAIDRATGVYSLSIPTNWTSDGESFTLRATYNSIPINKSYRIVKVRAGEEGPPGEGALEGWAVVDGPAGWIRDKDGATWEPAATTTDIDFTFELEGVVVARLSRRVTRTEAGVLTISTVAHPDGDLNTGRVQISVIGDGTRAVTVSATYDFEGHRKTVAQVVTAALSGEDGADGANSVNLFLLDTANILSTATGSFSAGSGVVFGSQLSTYARRVTLEEVGLDPGDVISASARIAYTDGTQTVALRIRFFDGTGASTGIFTGALATLTTLTRAVAENATIPANTASMELLARVSGGNGTVSIDRGMINRGPIAALYAAPSRGGIREVSIEDFISGIEPVVIHVGAKPAGVHLGVDLVLWTTDGLLYRWNNGTNQYSAAIPTEELSGQVTSAQIASLAANKIAAGTISVALALAHQIVLQTSGKIYSGTKSTPTNVANGVFLGHEAGSDYALAVGDGDRYFRYRTAIGYPEVKGGLVDNSPMNPAAARIYTGGTGASTRTAPFTVRDFGSASPVSGSAAASNRSVTLGLFLSPSSGSGYNRKRLAFFRMDFFLRIDIAGRNGNETLHFEYAYDGGAFVQALQHTFDASNRGSFHGSLRFTTRSTSWSNLWLRLRTSNTNTIHIAFDAMVMNNEESTNADNSVSAFTSSGTGYGSDPVPPPGWVIP